MWNKITRHRTTLAKMTRPIGPYGTMYDTGSAAGVTLQANEWLKVSGSTLVGPNLSEVTMSADHRLSYTGSEASVPCRLSGHANIVTTVDKLNVDLAFALNGVVDSGSIGRKFLTGSLAGSGSLLHAETIRTLSLNDYVELYVRPSKAATLTASFSMVSLSRAV